MTLSYAVAYPFGICGILLSMWLIRLIFRINVESEDRLYQQQSGVGRSNLQTMNVEVRNANLQGLTMQEIPDLEEGEVVCSRLKRGDELMVPKPDTVVQMGDLLHLVGDKKALKKVRLVIGEEVAASLSRQGTDMRVERVVVTNE